MDNEKEYMIDCEGLSTALAEDAWQEETRKLKDDELYIQVNGKKEVVHYWAATFMLLKDKYKQLISAFRIDKKSNVPYPATIENTREKCTNCGMEIWYPHEVEIGLCTFCDNKLNHVIK